MPANPQYAIHNHLEICFFIRVYAFCLTGTTWQVVLRSFSWTKQVIWSAWVKPTTGKTLKPPTKIRSQAQEKFLAVTVTHHACSNADLIEHGPLQFIFLKCPRTIFHLCVCKSCSSWKFQQNEFLSILLIYQDGRLFEGKRNQKNIQHSAKSYVN